MSPIRAVLVGLLVFAVIIIGFSGWAGDVATASGVPLNDDLGELASVSRIQNDTQQVTEAFTSGSLTSGPLESVLGAALTIAFGGFKILFVDSFLLVADAVNSISLYLKLPVWFTGIVISIVTLYLLFEVIRIFTRWQI